MGKLQLLAAVLAAGLISSWTTALLMKPSPPAVPPRSEPAQELGELTRQLDRLILAVEQLSLGAPVPSGEPYTPERVPVENQAWNEVASSLQELRGMMSREGWQSSAGTPAIIQAGLRQPGTQWQALLELRDAMRSGSVSRQSMLFLSQATILQRYGRPTSIGAEDDGTVVWSYLNGEEGDARVWTRFVFMDGYVIGVR